MNDELDQYWDEEVDDSYQVDDELDLDECGFSFEHGCQSAGSEYCQFECPFYPEYQSWLKGELDYSYLV